MDDFDLIKERLEPINGIIPTALPLARGRALAAMGELGLSRDVYRKLYADSFSATLRSELVNHPAGQWRVIHGSNCLHLLDGGSGMELRFIKAFALTGGLPPAGPNHARREAWSQGLLDLNERAGANGEETPLGGVKLILVWEEHADATESGLFRCTVYQPLEPGAFPHGADGRAIMSMPIGIDSNDYNDMSFSVDNTEERMIPRSNTIIEAAGEKAKTTM